MGNYIRKDKTEVSQEKYKILEKWRTREGFKASFMVMRCLRYEFMIDFIGKDPSSMPQASGQSLWQVT